MVDVEKPSKVEWSAVREAGGIDAWVYGELQRLGKTDYETDPSKLSGKALGEYKARRDEERRVRRALRRVAWDAYRGEHIVHLGADVFYHDTPDIDRYDLAEPAVRRKANSVPELADFRALATALEVDVRKLRWLAFHRDVDRVSHYTRWTVPKRSGGTRLISAPKRELKRIQRWIAANITERLPVHGAAHGFLRDRGTRTNAEAHAGARLIVKLDLKDFYPTITVRRVKGLFRKAGYGEQVATLLAALCTESPREVMTVDGKPHYVATAPRSLPQGAPTSPSITNSLCMRLDRRLSLIAGRLGFVYTRYADDLTFSWGPKTTAPIEKLLGSVRRVVEDEGFVLHKDKTRVLRSGGCQRVTGLVVNESAGAPVRVPRELRRELRAAIHNLERGKGRGDSLDKLRGLAAYVHMTHPELGREYLDRLAKIGAPRE